MSTYNQEGQNVRRDQYNIGGDAHFHGTPTPTPAPPRQLRAPVGDFVGRTDDIDVLCSALTVGNQAAAICGVRGMGGIGKTELAMVVANRLADQFPDGQIVVDLLGTKTPLTSEGALQEIIRAFDPTMQLPSDLPSLQKLYRQYCSGKRVLILADDAADAAQTRPLLPPKGCALIVTSRHSFTLPGMHTRNLDTLAPADAEALLLTICPRIEGHAAALAKLCGYLPLALRVSASLLDADETRDVARYLTQLEQARLHHLADPDGDPNDPQASVAASFALSYATLPAAAQQTFDQVSVFVGGFDLPAAQRVVSLPDAMPDLSSYAEQLQALMAGELDPESAEGQALVQAVQAAQAQEYAAIEQQMSLLVRRSLLGYDPATARYSQHDLLRDYGRARLPAEAERAARTRHARYYESVLKYAQFELYLKGKPLAALALFDQERQQTDAVWGWLLGQVAGDAPPPADAVRDQLILDMADATVYTGGELRYSPALRIPQLAAQAAAARRLGNKSHEGQALGNLGLAHRALGDARTAIDYHEQDLAIAREIGDRRGEGNALGNLGLAHAALGDARTAIGYHEQHLAVAREIGDRRGEGGALGNLGLAHAALGDARTAMDYYEQALVVMREIGDQRSEGAATVNIGRAHLDLKDYARALQFSEQAYELFRSLGAKDGECHASGDMGVAYAALGDDAQATVYLQLSRTLADEISAPRIVPEDMWNLGVIYEERDDIRRAIECMEEAVAYYQSIGHATAADKAARLARVRARVGGGG